MPSDLGNLQDSFFSHSASLPSERQLGFWKSETVVKSEVKGNAIASSRLGKLLPVGSQMGKPLDRLESYPNQDQKVKPSSGHSVGEEAAASHSLTLLRPVDQDPVQLTSYFAEDKKNSMLGAQYENGLFSSSLSELFCRKLRLSSNDASNGHPADVVASNCEEEPFESLEEIEAQTIGNLLPNDDDLLSGMTEGLNCIVQSNNVDEVEELDIFSSLGGMDIGDDISSSAGKRNPSPLGVANGKSGPYNRSVSARHPYEEHASRTLLAKNVSSDIEDSELRALFEQYGDLRTLYTACKHHGFVIVSYYDIRSAQNAIKALQNSQLRNQKLDIHFSDLRDNPSNKEISRGTLVVYNLDSSVSNEELYQIFGGYGEVKEIWEIPRSNDCKFIEFYDVRAAEAALPALNGSDISGKRIKLEPTLLEGRKCMMQMLHSDLDQRELGCFLQQSSPPCNSTTGFSVPPSSIYNGDLMGLHYGVRASINPLMENGLRHGISSGSPNGLQSLLRVDSVGNQSGPALPGPAQGKSSDMWGTSAFHPNSLPEYRDGLINSGSPGTVAANIHLLRERINGKQLHSVNTNAQPSELSETVLNSSSGSHPIPGHHFTLNNSYQKPPGMMWPNSPSPSFVNGICSPHPPPQLHGLPRAPSHMANRVLPVNNHHVGSAPTVNHMWDRSRAFTGESPEASGFHPGSLGSMGVSNNSLHSMDFAAHNIFPNLGGSMNLPIHQRNGGLQTQQQRCMMFPGRGHMFPVMNLCDHPTERARSRRSETGSTQADRKQFELDIDRIFQGEDSRTTLMIKNIPNKYTSKMLLAAIDERHKGTYDFIYLPIDFKNKCNVGYAFINMTDPKHIIPFFQTFNGKKWEKFNSEKVATLAYARIQGKAALIAHFQNSSLMNEDKRCRPILFNTEGPNAGDQVPFPMGVNVRTRPGRSRTTTHEENHQGSPPSAVAEKSITTGNSCPDSAKESD